MTHQRNIIKRLAAVIAVVAVFGAWNGWASAPAKSAAASARTGTAAFHNVNTAKDAGYGEFTDAAGIACIDDPTGGMGIHYANLGLVLDGQIDASTPEVLVYEPEPNGRLRLVAVEYVVFQADWDATHDDPPT